MTFFDPSAFIKEETVVLVVPKDERTVVNATDDAVDAEDELELLFRPVTSIEEEVDSVNADLPLFLIEVDIDEDTETAVDDPVFLSPETAMADEDETETLPPALEVKDAALKSSCRDVALSANIPKYPADE